MFWFSHLGWSKPHRCWIDLNWSVRLDDAMLGQGSSCFRSPGRRLEQAHSGKGDMWQFRFGIVMTCHAAVVSWHFSILLVSIYIYMYICYILFIMVYACLYIYIYCRMKYLYMPTVTWKRHVHLLIQQNIHCRFGEPLAVSWDHRHWQHWWLLQCHQIRLNLELITSTVVLKIFLLWTGIRDDITT